MAASCAVCTALHACDTTPMQALCVIFIVGTLFISSSKAKPINMLSNSQEGPERGFAGIAWQIWA